MSVLRVVLCLKDRLGQCHEEFVIDNKFVLIAAFFEGLQSKVSKKVFDAAEFSGPSYYSSSFYMDRF